MWNEVVEALAQPNLDTAEPLAAPPSPPRSPFYRRPPVGRTASSEERTTTSVAAIAASQIVTRRAGTKLRLRRRLQRTRISRLIESASTRGLNAERSTTSGELPKVRPSGVLGHIDVRHTVGVPLSNRFLSFSYSIHWLTLLAVILASFAALTMPLALIMWGSSCTSRDFGMTYVLTLAHLVSFGEEGLARESDAPGCILLSTGFSLIALLLQAAIFALTVTRFINPNIQLVLPVRPCVVKRDGRSNLSVRIIHPQGHLVSNITVHCVWSRPKTTDEGERFYALDVIKFNDNVHRHVSMPKTFLHPIDTESPLAPWGDVRQAPGRITLYVQGYDEVLRTSICNHMSYALADVAYGRWRDVIMRTEPPGGSAEAGRQRAGLVARLLALLRSGEELRLLYRRLRPGNLATDFIIDMRSFHCIDEDTGAPPPGRL